MTHSHFFLSPLLVYEGTELKLAMHRALISRSGIYKVFEEGEDIAKAFLEARVFRVQLDGADFHARLARESSPHGVHYNLHLIDPGPQLEFWLQGALERRGFESPWKRDYNRVPTVGDVLQNEYPAQVLINGKRAEIKNFSYHGLFVQLEGVTQGVEAVGEHIRFQVLSSRGKLLEDFSGKVARIYDEAEGPGRFRRGLGIRLTEIGEESRKAYHWMILDACRELQWVPVG